jgi:PadR family transcriptional regulator, regulatory protein AphA
MVVDTSCMALLLSCGYSSRGVRYSSEGGYVKPQKLSTTAYSILGLLAVRPWSAYELTTQVQRGLRWFWPRSGNKLYELPKQLVTAGLATATAAQTGRRKRTVYSITDQGRHELTRWLGEASTPPVLEFEGLVRVLFADQGSTDQLQRTLAEVRDQVRWMQLQGAAIGREYVASGGGPFPERLHVNALIFELLWRYTEALGGWAEWAAAEAGRWDGVGDQPDRRAALLERYREITALVDQRQKPPVETGPAGSYPL